MIKLASPCLGELEKQAVCRVLDSHVINMGEETREFEKELKEFFNVPDANVICVNSCTAALHLSLQALGMGPGDEVLVPTYTFISTFQAIAATGAKPIPVDIDFSDGFIDINDFLKRISTKTKAIVPVSFAGCGGDKIGKVYEIAKERGIAVVEDVAHCFGEEEIADRDGVLCFSFDAIKNITCSDGGCIVTKDKKIAAYVQDSRLLGVKGDTEARYSGRRSWDADTTEQGWRYHMSNICAAIGRAQLSRFEEFKKARQRYAGMYMDGFRENENIQLFPLNIRTAVPHIFPIIIKSEKRDQLKAFLYENGVETGVQYKLNHRLTKFNLGYSLPNAERLYDHVLSIPLHPRLSEQDVLYVIDKINEFLK